jgi:long-chain acyl-CoA synthetase
MPLSAAFWLEREDRVPMPQTSLLVEKLLQQDDPAFAMIVEDGCQWRLSDFREQVYRLASHLNERGIQPGDRVALMFMNQKEYLVGFFAVLHAGAVVTPINITLPHEDIAYVIGDSGASLMLADASFAPLLDGRLPIPMLMANSPDPAKFPSLEAAIEQGDPQFAGRPAGDANTMRILMYTSGTTGRPKGVMLSEQNLLANMEGLHPVLRLHEGERLLLALPLFHAYGQIIALYALHCKAPIYLVPNFAPKKILQTLVEHQINLLPLVPTLFSVLLSSIPKVGVENLRHLKACVSGGAALPEALLKTLEGMLDLQVIEGYGMTETAPVLAVNERRSEGKEIIAKSVGRPLPNLEMKLVDEQGNSIVHEPGQVSAEGEIVVRGPNVMLGYYNLPEETKQTFDADGFLKTGDLGHFDAEGRLFISGGRKKDLIIKAGENIAPVRIEEVLMQHPAVRNVAVIGIPDDKLGEDILACVERQPDVFTSEAELRRFCRDNLTPFLVPASIRFYDELPKNPAGKILKPKLRQENALIQS